MLRVIFISLSFLWTVCSPHLSYADLVGGTFVSGGHRFQFEGLSNLKYPFLRLQSEPLLLITHSSHYWDPGHRTWPGTALLVNFFRDRGFPIKYLAAIEERSLTHDVALKLAHLYFPPGIGMEDVYPYQGDSHRIITAGQHVVITGGNFTICACNTARSIIALSEGTLPLHLHYVMEALYEGQMGVQLTLSEISDRLDDGQFMTYLSEQYFNSSDPQDTLPCMAPSLFAVDRNFRYKIYRGGRLIGQYGQGKVLVMMHFEKATDAMRHID